MATEKSLAEPKKNICFFNSYSLWGGGEKWHFRAALRAKELGHRVFIASGTNGMLLKRAAEKGLETFPLSVGKRSYYSPLFLAKLYRFFKLNKIDVVVFNSPIDVRLASLVASWAGVKTLMLRSGMPIAPKQKRSNIVAFRRLTHIFGNCLEIKRVFLEEAPLLVKHVQFATIYNGIDFSDHKSEHLDHAPITLGSLSRLSEQKGIEYLLQAARKLIDQNISFKLLIAGTGEDEEKLKSKAQELQLTPQVEFTGFTERPQEFLKSIDILAFSSLWEGCSNTLIEAMGEGLAIVCFDISTMPEIITHEKTGLLARAKDADHLAESLKRLIEDQSLRKRLGEEAYREARERFDYQKNIDQFFKLI